MNKSRHCSREKQETNDEERDGDICPLEQDRIKQRWIALLHKLKIDVNVDDYVARTKSLTEEARQMMVLLCDHDDEADWILCSGFTMFEVCFNLVVLHGCSVDVLLSCIRTLMMSQ
jgi:hypothetical protein